MLPAQRNKVDISKLTPQEQQAFRLYGKLPSRPVSKTQERKYFDSGDYALAKAGKTKEYGKEIPTPDAIPHASPSPIPGSQGGSVSGSSSSPPTSGAFSPSVPGAIPMSTSTGVAPGSTSSSGSDAAAGAGAGEAGINLSMSPGRVGVGQPLATSPTRGFGSFPIASAVHNQSYHNNPNNPIVSNPLAGRAETDAMGTTTSMQGDHTNNPMLSATTGNQVGRTHVRRTSQSQGEGGVSSPPPTSGLANSITAEQSNDEEQVQGMMELQ